MGENNTWEGIEEEADRIRAKNTQNFLNSYYKPVTILRAWLVQVYLTLTIASLVADGKTSARNAGDPGSIPVGKIPWRRKWQSTPAFLPGKSHGRRSLIGYSPWGRKESDTTDRLHFHFIALESRYYYHSYFQGMKLRHTESRPRWSYPCCCCCC